MPQVPQSARRLIAQVFAVDTTIAATTMQAVLVSTRCMLNSGHSLKTNADAINATTAFEFVGGERIDTGITRADTA